MSAVLQNVSGIPYEANWAVPNALIAPSLGRNLAACGSQAVCSATALVPLIEPQTQFERRRTVLDLRLTKSFTLGPKMRIRANLDAYNLTNDGSVVLNNHSYGAFWRRPVGLGQPAARLIQFGGKLTF